MPLGATLAAATEGFPEVVVAATLAVVPAAFLELHAEAASQEVAFPELHAEAALLEVASRVEADMVVGGVKRLAGTGFALPPRWLARAPARAPEAGAVPCQ